MPANIADVPSHTTLIEHDTDVGDHAPIRQHAYRANPVKRNKHRLAVPSVSSRCSPCIKVNAANTPDLQPDSFPIRGMEDCVDCVGTARFTSKLDLLKIF